MALLDSHGIQNIKIELLLKPVNTLETTFYIIIKKKKKQKK